MGMGSALCVGSWPALGEMRGWKRMTSPTSASASFARSLRVGVTSAESVLGRTTSACIAAADAIGGDRKDSAKMSRMKRKVT